MFFTTINQFLTDLKTIFSTQNDETQNLHSTDDPNIMSLGESKKAKEQAGVRTIAQLILTLFVIGLCLYVVINANENNIGGKLAYTGFGIVFGYWFR